MLVWCGCVELGAEALRFGVRREVDSMDTRFVQRKSLGHALVATQSLDEGLALARSLGADGPVYSQLEKMAPPCHVGEGRTPVGRHIIVVGADAVPALRVASRTWDRPHPPVILVQWEVAVSDMVHRRCPRCLCAARASLLPVFLVRDGVARDLDTGEWWERGGEGDGGFVSTNSYDARCVLTDAVRERIDDIMQGGGGPVLGSGGTDGDVVQYWSRVLQAPPAMCYEAIERRGAS